MTPLVIDTDPGIDDASAILLAAASPEVDLRAVTTVFGNVELPKTTRNALAVLALAGRPDVPVAAGASRPLVHPQPHRAAEWHADDGLGGKADILPAPERSVEQRGAVELLADVLRSSTEPVTIAPIGPLTNIALLLATHPELAPKIGRLVIMGGGISGGNVTPAAEFNVWSDPEAARRVLVEEDVPITLVPLDLTQRVRLDSTWRADLAAAGGRAAVLAEIMVHYADRYARYFGSDGVPMHDAVALLEAIVPGTLHTTPLPLDVICDHGPARGLTLADRRPTTPARPIDVALDADVDHVRTEVLSRLTRAS